VVVVVVVVVPEPPGSGAEPPLIPHEIKVVMANKLMSAKIIFIKTPASP
jgi:hypothetical protein